MFLTRRVSDTSLSVFYVCRIIYIRECGQRFIIQTLFFKRKITFEEAYFQSDSFYFTKFQFWSFWRNTEDNKRHPCSNICTYIYKCTRIFICTYTLYMYHIDHNTMNSCSTAARCRLHAVCFDMQTQKQVFISC